MPKKKVTPVNKKKKTTRAKANTPVRSSLLPKVTGFLKTPWGLAIVLVVAVIGIWVVLSSRAATTGTASCGATVSNYNYQVPYGRAVWNQPICGLPRHPQSADYASRLYKWGNVNDGTSTANYGKLGASPGYPDTKDINPYGNLFTREVYYASKATTEASVASTEYYSNLDGEKVNTFTPSTKIPWNPSWQTGQGGDNEMIIIDDRPGATQGRIYFLSGYWASEPRFPYRKIPPLGCYPIWDQGRLCTYSTTVARDLNGNYVDYRTYEGFIKDRGVGIPYLATLTLPEEVEAGEIRHALGISIPNTAYGPVCTKAQQGDWNQEGKTCGTAVMPASKFEWAGAPAPPVMEEAYKKIYTIDKTIPEGMRFGLNMTYAQIDQWIQSRPDLVSNPRRAKTARIIAVAMRDYGLLVADTNGNRMGLQMAGGINPDNAKKWTDLGLGPNEKDNLLDGLMTATNMYVVDPPIGTCKDGTKSKYFCPWSSAQYTAASTSSPSPTATVTQTVTPTQTASPTTTSSPTVTSNPSTPSAAPPGSKTSPAPTTSPVPTSDKVAPSVPTGITRGLVIDPTRVAYNLEIKWKASTDTGGSGIKDYLITRNDGKNWTSVSPIVVDNTVVANTLYTYEIKARDNAGNISAPATTSAKGACLLIWCWLE